MCSSKYVKPNKKLTISLVRDAKYAGHGKGLYLIHDTEIPGFALRIYPSGRKTFVIRYALTPGRWQWLTVGRVPPMTVHQARELARARLAMAASGTDPTGRGDKPAPTVAEFAARFLEEYSRIQRPRTFPHDLSRIRKYIVPRFGKMRIDEVSTGDLVTFHANIGKEFPSTANRVLELFRAIWNRALDWGVLREGSRNPARRVKKFRETPRDRFLTRDEARRLLEAADRLQHPRFRYLIRLYLLTGARKMEILRLKWDDVNIPEGWIRFSRTKRGRPHYLTPGKGVFEIFHALQKLAVPGNDYVFPVGDSHWREPRGQWKRVLDMAGIEGLHIHDLRRTAITWLAEAGVSSQQVGHVVQHSTADITDRYIQFQPTATRRPLEVLEEILSSFHN